VQFQDEPDGWQRDDATRSQCPRIDHGPACVDSDQDKVCLHPEALNRARLQQQPETCR
jgi:hypothetical protein